MTTQPDEPVFGLEESASKGNANLTGNLNQACTDDSLKLAAVVEWRKVPIVVDPDLEVKQVRSVCRPLIYHTRSGHKKEK